MNAMDGVWAPIASTYDPIKCGSIDASHDYPHDRAVQRACCTKYKPNKQVAGDPLCTIFVGKLDPSTDEVKLHEVFEEYGTIKSLRLVRDIISGFSKRFAFIEYMSGSSARQATRSADKSCIDDSQILVDMELERELPGWIPRRFGGGFGGKKESGQLRFGGKHRPFKRPINLSEPHGGVAEHSHTSQNRYQERFGWDGPRQGHYSRERRDESRNHERGERRYDNHKSSNQSERRHERSRQRHEYSRRTRSRSRSHSTSRSTSKISQNRRHRADSRERSYSRHCSSSRRRQSNYESRSPSERRQRLEERHLDYKQRDSVEKARLNIEQHDHGDTFTEDLSEGEITSDRSHKHKKTRSHKHKKHKHGSRSPSQTEATL